MSDTSRIVPIEPIQIADLPEQFKDEVVRQIRTYAVGLALETHLRRAGDEVEKEYCDFVGSGTLISWGKHYGILTADHVPQYPRDAILRLDTRWGSKQRLRVLFEDRVNTFGFDAKALIVHSLGRPAQDTFGPDIAVIQLPLCEELSTLIAKKSFWNLTNQTEDKLSRAMVSGSCMAIVGHPGEDVQDQVGPTGGFQEATFAPGMVGFTGQTAYFEHEGLDYIEIDSRRTVENEAPKSYGGISGGSLWRIPILRRPTDDNSQVYPGELVLAGVPFWQFPENEGLITVRGHGPRTIYQNLLSMLTASS